LKSSPTPPLSFVFEIRFDNGTKADQNTDQINEITVLCQKLNKKDKKSVL